MNKEKGNAVLWLIVIVVIIGAIWWWKRSSTSENGPVTTTQTQDNALGSDYTPAPSQDASSATSTQSDEAAIPKTVTVNYTSAGFEPKTVTIKKGDLVTWINKTNHGMWLASAMHPTHTVYDGTSLAQHCQNSSSTSFDQCQSGNTYTFKFDKVGSWAYHDHLTAGMFGTIVVTE